MGCDIHIIIQILDNDEYKFVCESKITSKKITIDEHLTFIIHDSLSNEKLISISSEELKNNFIEHNNCQVDQCECKYDFNVHFNIRRDYVLFRKIANVRSYENSAENMEPRGLPEENDILEHILYEVNDDIPSCKCLYTDELHSHTYLDDNEIDDLNIENSEGLKELKRILSRVRENFPDCKSRFVIAFDN